MVIADIVYKFWYDETPSSYDGCEELFQKIEAQIKLAMDENDLECIAHARESYCPRCEDSFKRGFSAGELAMRGRAAKTADGILTWAMSLKAHAEEIGKQIRSLAPTKGTTNE